MEGYARRWEGHSLAANQCFDMSEFANNHSQNGRFYNSTNLENTSARSRITECLQNILRWAIGRGSDEYGKQKQLSENSFSELPSCKKPIKKLNRPPIQRDSTHECFDVDKTGQVPFMASDRICMSRDSGEEESGRGRWMEGNGQNGEEGQHRRIGKWLSW